MKQLGFKNTLILVVTGLLIIALGLTSYISISKLKDTATESLLGNILRASQYEVEGIQSYIEKNSQPVAELAKLYDKYDYSENHEKYMEFAAKVAGASKITLGMDDGRSYTSKESKTFPGGVGKTDKYDPRTRSWYKLGKQVSDLSLVDVFITKQGAPLSGAVYPIKGGVLLADVRLSHLQEILEGVDVVEGAVGMIVDQNGMVLASTSESIKIQDKLKDIDGLSDFSSNMFGEENVIEELNLNGIDSLIVSSRIELVGSKPWYLIVSVDRQIAFASVHSASQQLLLVVLAIMMFFVGTLYFVLNRIYRPVIALKKLVASLSSGDGDLTQRLEVNTDDDLGQIANSVNTFIESLQSMILEVKRVSGRLSEGVSVLKTHSDQSASILEQHQQETDLVVTAVEELSTSAELVAENAQEAAQFTQEANTSGETSKETIANAQRSLQRLSEEVEGATRNVTNMSHETQDISSILSVIGGIADQTNLLALNAAIEAARAGEQGRGFAVVADEVRALAGRTQDSTGEIEQALEKLQHEAGSVVNSIESTKNTSEQTVDEAAGVSASLEVMSDYVTKINDLSIQISSSAQEQNAVIQEISQNMARIHTMVEELTTTGSSVNQETHHINEINEQLNGIVGQFKLS